MSLVTFEYGFVNVSVKTFQWAMIMLPKYATVKLKDIIYK